jgi:hypothetical protein
MERLTKAPFRAEQRPQDGCGDAMTNNQMVTMHDRESAVDVGLDGMGREQMLPQRTLLRLQPEARLALAVLEDAAETLRTTYGVRTLRAQRLASQTWTWLESNDTGHLFAFRVICQYLDLDAEWLRSGLARWRPVTSASVLGEDRPTRRRRRAA